MRRTIFFLLLAWTLLGMWSPAQAESQVELAAEVDHIFGQEISIQGTVESEIQIQNLRVVIQSEDGTVFTDSIPPSPDGSISYVLDVAQNPIRAFSRLAIKFDVELENGEIVSIPLEAYDYDDNRFNWQSLSTDEFTIHWYQPDEALGEKILNVAYEGLERIQSQIDVPAPRQIEMYAYASARELQDTLLYTGQSAAWVAGHADPDLGLIVVSLPPGPDQTFEIRRQIPHELVHILLHQKLGTGYPNLPRWLNEGLASIAELFPNPDYQLLLDKAYEREALIPIADLCSGFPLDAATFQLSYAESYDFVWYLHQTYGKSEIEKLIEAYANGMGCNQGAESALGASLTTLQGNWRKLRFGENLMLRSLNLFAPWIFMAVLVLAAPVGWMVNGWSRRKRRGS